jgi:hypothetical protein
MAFCNNGPLDVPELLMQADQALYDAKERGRNRVEIASLDLVQKRKNSLPRSYCRRTRRPRRGVTNSLHLPNP